jgi:hypothetical protein
VAAEDRRPVARRADRERRAPRDRITYDNGETSEIETGTGREVARRYLQQRHPPPTREATDFESWLKALPKEDLRAWEAHVYMPGEVKELDFDYEVENWHYGVPITFVLRALDDLAATGWTILHVSEDQGLYAGADAADEAYPARIRYLLTRDTGE